MDNYVIPEVPLSQRFHDLVAKHLTPLSEKEMEFEEELEEQEKYLEGLMITRQMYFDSWKPSIASAQVERYVERVKALLYSLEEVVDPAHCSLMIRLGEEALFAIKSLETYSGGVEEDKGRMRKETEQLKRSLDKVAKHLKMVIDKVDHAWVG